MGAAKKLTHQTHLHLVKDYVQTAAAAKLVYVSDKEPGIIRLKAGRGFSYRLDDMPLKDKQEIARINRLAIPPAWENVWICTKANGHIQATGFDSRQRKQYRYHPLWGLLRNETKFHKLLEFGKQLPHLRLQIESDLSGKELTEKKVISAVISLMERTYIRIGNVEYEKQNGSHGLTTLHDKHVSIDGSSISFSFRGKKGIGHRISLKNKKLAKIVQQCRDIPGKELFQYYDGDGHRRTIDSGMVNQYLKEYTGADYTAKDFRTWAGCLNLLRAFKTMGCYESTNQCRQNINRALDYVSERLGNTRTVCRKYYVHLGIIRLYEENKILDYLSELDGIEEPDGVAALTRDEKVLMKLLAVV